MNQRNAFPARLMDLKPYPERCIQRYGIFGTKARRW